MSLIDWQTEAPNGGTYTVFNLTEYSSGDSEATVTTVKDSEPRRKKKNLTPEEMEEAHENLLNSQGLTGKDADLFMENFCKEKSELEKEENKQRSLRRTKSNVRKIIIEGSLDHFLTLTYRDNMTDEEQGWRDWKRFIRLVQKKYPTIKYLVIYERQKRGAIHFHVAVGGFLHANTIRSLWLSVVGSGNIDIKRKNHKQSLHGMAKYITKYITKQHDEIENYKNIYRVSRNIKLKQLKLYLPREFAMTRGHEIETALNHFIKDIRQFWEDSNGLYSVQWASSLAP